MKYGARNQKRIDLPSGAWVKIRKYNGLDAMGTGEIPILETEIKKLRAGGDSVDDATALKAKKHAFAVAVIMLTKCTGEGIHWIDTDTGTEEVFRIVHKAEDSCQAGEVPISLVDQEDADAICEAIQIFSGAEEVAAAATFPVESPELPSDRPDIETVRETSDGDPQRVSA